MFSTYDVSIMEKFETIFDTAENEKDAKQRAVTYYLNLTEDGDIDLDVQEIIETAESYGFDFSNFEELIDQNES